MPPPNRTISGDRAIEEFINDLEATSDQVKKLLDTVRAGELDLTALKTELRILCENVKDLSSLIRGGDGGMPLITRIALLEEKLKDLEKDIDKKDENAKTTQQSLADIVVADKTGSWQMKTAFATGIVGVLATLATVIAELLK